MQKNKFTFIIIAIVIFIYLIIGSIVIGGIIDNNKEGGWGRETTFKLISSTENKDIENILQSYADKNDIDLEIDYAGTIEIMDKLNQGEEYDAVWCSNSIWLYMLNDDVTVTNSKSTSINPVVFGIKKSKAQELGFIGKDVYTKDILNAIKQGNLKFSMSSPTQTNTGATAYLGFLSTLAGNPEVLTEENLKDETLKSQLTQLYAGVTRSSGSDEFLEEMFLNGNYEAVVTYESSIININKQLEEQGKEPLYIIYAKDGVSISDSPFAYIDHKDDTKEEQFSQLQSYVLSSEGQQELVKTGRRVWYGGTNENADKSVFNPDWGIDTTKYIVPVKYPSTTVIRQALSIYQTELRKPIHIVFCLDYSGSMYGRGITQLKEAMEYILNEEEASKDLLQFAQKDKITIIPFTHNILETYSTANGTDTEELIQKISQTDVGGGTDIYLPVIEALKILDKEDLETYNTSIVLMSDGASNYNRIEQLRQTYRAIGKDIPVFSIMFGSASQEQLQDIADLTNAKVFDGKTNLLEAFKQVRGYN